MPISIYMVLITQGQIEKHEIFFKSQSRSFKYYDRVNREKNKLILKVALKYPDSYTRHYSSVFGFLWTLTFLHQNFCQFSINIFDPKAQSLEGGDFYANHYPTFLRVQRRPAPIYTSFLEKFQ